MLIASAAARAIASLSAYVTTKYLVRIALDREEPRAMKKAEKLISGSQSDNDFIIKVNEAAERLAEK